MSNHTSTAPDAAALRDEWAREVLAAAEALRQTGHHKRLRDITIVHPNDFAAVEAVELACTALAQGELSDAAAELNHFLDRLAADPTAGGRFLASVRNVVGRVGPPPPDPPP